MVVEKTELNIREKLIWKIVKIVSPNLFPKLIIAHNKYESARRAKELINDLLRVYKDKPIITLNGVDSDVIVGYVTHYTEVGANGLCLPIVQDYVSGNSVICFSKLLPFSNEMIDQLCSMDKYVRWSLLDYFDPNKSRIGITDDTADFICMSADEVREKLKDNGFNHS